MYLLDEIFFDEALDCFEQTYDLDELLESDEDWVVKLEICELDHIVQFDGNSISEYIDDERLTEDNDVNDRKRVAEVLNTHIDWDKVNSLIPKLWYGTGKYETFTKQEVINELQANS